MEQTSGPIGRAAGDRRNLLGFVHGMRMGGYAGMSGLAGAVALLVFGLVHVSPGGLLSFGRHGSTAADAEKSHRADAQASHDIFATTDDAQNMWTAQFTAKGQVYQRADVVLYRGLTYSSCGAAQAQIGPFYCAAEQKIYVDMDFWNDLKKAAGANAGLAAAYVLGHEMGHHVVHQMAMRNGIPTVRMTASAAREAALATELKSDCYAGVWAHSADERGELEAGDVNAALRAAMVVSEAHLQQMSGRAVSPEIWTMQEIAQREQWFTTGLRSGDVANCSAAGAGSAGVPTVSHGR